ncbi:MAG: hypothetical protein QF667_04445 [Candidatus Marinimicrobia bacterium]|nr:hypothetical protein [Candidatus Neomarinimicrobiota bacterium]
MIPIPVVKRELDLFETIKMQINYDHFRLEKISPLNGGTDPLEFHINGSGEDYIWPQMHYLHLWIKITQNGGENLANDDTTTPVNNFVHSLWNEVKVTINGTVVTPKDENYAYKAFFERLFSFGDCAMKSQGEAALFIKDLAGQMEHHTLNTGAAARRRYIAESKTLEVLCPLNIDLFLQGQVIPNGCDINIKLSRNPVLFSLMMPDNNGRKISMTKSDLIIAKPRLNPATFLAHANAFQQGAMAIYPIRRCETRTAVIEQGVLSKTLANICTGQLPRRVVVGLVSNTAYNGAHNENPFNFQHYDLNYLALHLDGELRPNIPLTPNFTDDLYLESYMSLFLATDKLNRDEGLIVTRSDYSQGYALYAFDLSADQSADATHFDTIKSGNFKLDFKFARATPHSINAVIRLEFDSTIRIDRNKSVILDY